MMLVDMPCLAALGNKFMTGLRSGSTQNLTNTVWAYAQMKVRSTTLFYSVAQEALRRLPEFRERDLSITAWSYGRLELREETLILAISREAMSRDFRGKHQEIANLCWAMAQLDLRDTRLLEGMAAAALSSELRDFSSQELANTLWSFASLKVQNEALTDSFAAHVLTEVLPEAISQNIVNIAWALNCLEWKDNQGGFHRILSHFLKVCSRSLGVEWVTLASIAQERGLQSLNGFWAQFESFVLAPALRHLEALRVALSEVTFNERFQTMQRWVDEIQLPHLGPKFLTDALLAAGAQRAQSTAEWMMEARAAVADTAWWSCPKAAVSSQGVVAFLSAELQVGARRVTDPGTVYQADDAPGLVLVERLLQPIYYRCPGMATPNGGPWWPFCDRCCRVLPVTPRFSRTPQASFGFTHRTTFASRVWPRWRNSRGSCPRSCWRWVAMTLGAVGGTEKQKRSTSRPVEGCNRERLEEWEDL